MRTNGAGNEQLMTMTVIAVAVMVGMVVAGGPMELVQVLNEMAQSVVSASRNAVSAATPR